MDSNYDEDLMDNTFFQMLRKDYAEIFLKATMEGCVLCVPRSGSLPKYMLFLEDILSHILIPSDEMPESHFRTLNGKEVKICNQVVTVEHDIGHQTSTHVLFEETFYTEDFLKYKVLCLEQPLEQRLDSSHVNNNIITLRTLRDCMDTLWIESGNKDVIESIDEAVNNFLTTNPKLESSDLQTIMDLTGLLYTKCVQIVLKDPRLKEKTLSNKHVLDKLKTAVETYMHHGIYKKVIKGVSTCTSFEDAQLNKIIRNLSEIQIRDLEVRSELHETIPKAKSELLKIDGYSTVLGKLGCLKKMLSAVSKHPVNGNVVAADDLLPIIVFLVIKTGLPNWHAHLNYMKLFRFSVPSYQNDEGSFLITSLEAAIEHIQSGILLGSACPEGQGSGLDLEKDDSNLQMFQLERKTPFHSLKTMSNFFHQICLGNLEEVKEILKRNEKQEVNYGSLNLCHPLCTCENCKSLIRKNLCDTTPTVKSCDDRGLSALHIASMYGRPKIVDYLLTRGADPNVTDCNGLTPIHYAAMRGHQNALLLLAHCGADVNSPDNSFNTPLHFSSNNGHEGSVKALIYFCEHIGVKLSVNAQNVSGDSALHHASRWGYVNIVKILLENSANPAVQNRRKLTALDLTHNSKVSDLLVSGMSRQQSRFLRIKGKVPQSPSFDFSDDEKTRNKNLVTGVRPTSSDHMKKVERLLRAVACGDLNLACFYLSLDPNSFQASPAEVNKPPELKKCHPLCSCDSCQSSGSQKTVVKKDSLDVNVCNSDGLTPLHIAVMHGRMELTRVLVNNGALLNVQSMNKHVTPLMLACQNQRHQITKLLLLSGCDTDLQDHKGNSALHYACHTTNVRLVELLITFEAKLNLRNLNNKTPLQEAEEKMSWGVIKALRGGKAFNLNVL